MFKLLRQEHPLLSNLYRQIPTLSKYILSKFPFIGTYIRKKKVTVSKSSSNESTHSIMLPYTCTSAYIITILSMLSKTVDPSDKI